jgi:hypothetical protein
MKHKHTHKDRGCLPWLLGELSLGLGHLPVRDCQRRCMKAFVFACSLSRRENLVLQLRRAISFCIRVTGFVDEMKYRSTKKNYYLFFFDMAHVHKPSSSCLLEVWRKCLWAFNCRLVLEAVIYVICRINPNQMDARK